jgi:hypothetical protein
MQREAYSLTPPHGSLVTSLQPQPLFCSGSLFTDHCGPTSTGEITVNTGIAPYTSARLLIWDVAWSPRGFVRDKLSMCHARLQHGLKQATRNTFGAGSWSTVTYCVYSERDLPRGLARDHPAQHQDRSLAICRRAWLPLKSSVVRF